MQRKSCPYGKSVLTEIIDGRGVRYIEQKHFYRCALARQLKGHSNKERGIEIAAKEKGDFGGMNLSVWCPDPNCVYASGEEIFDRTGKE